MLGRLSFRTIRICCSCIMQIENVWALVFQHACLISGNLQWAFPLNKLIKVTDHKNKNRQSGCFLRLKDWINCPHETVILPDIQNPLGDSLLVYYKKTWLLQLQTTTSAPTNCCPPSKWVNKSVLKQSLNPTIRSLSLPWQNYTLCLMTKQHCAQLFSYSDKRAAWWTYTQAFDDRDQERETERRQTQ